MCPRGAEGSVKQKQAKTSQREQPESWCPGLLFLMEEQERTGQDRTGEIRKGQDRTGQERRKQERREQERGGDGRGEGKGGEGSREKEWKRERRGGRGKRRGRELCPCKFCSAHANRLTNSIRLRWPLIFLRPSFSVTLVTALVPPST